MNNSDNMVANDSSSKVIKIQVTSADIVVNGTVDNPYYEIKYREIGCDEYHIGYGSYDLNNVFEWLKECFELVSTDNAAQPESVSSVLEQEWKELKENLKKEQPYKTIYNFLVWLNEKLKI